VPLGFTLDCALSEQHWDRGCYIDAVEAANQGGTVVLADGVDSEQELLLMKGIGVELLHGLV
jgi:hypothetical protein